MEQTFTVATTQVQANTSASTVHNTSLRTLAIHSVAQSSTSSGSKQPHRANRSSENRAEVAVELENVVAKHREIRNELGSDVLKSSWSKLGSKRKVAVTESTARMRSEFDANSRPDQHLFTSNNILETGKRYAVAQILKSSELPEVEVEAYVAESKCWTKAPRSSIP